MKKLWRIIRNIGKWLVKYIGVIILILAFISLIISINKSNKSIDNHVVQEVFDLKTTPNGYVIWQHGVLGTETNFIHADTIVRYKYFDIGIVTNEMVVYKIRVPYYAIGMFKLGSEVKYRKKPQKNWFENKRNL